MVDPKRHHYLPRFYLQGFCRGDSFWVYDRHLKEYRSQTPANTAVETHFYATVDPNGVRDTKLERAISQIETYAAPIVQKVDKRFPLSGEDKFVLSVFVGLLRARVPEFAREQEELRRTILDKIAPLVDRVGVHAPDNPADPPVSVSGEEGYDALEVIAQLRALESDHTASHNDFLQMIIPITRELSKHLLGMNWIIARPPRTHHFVTSDNPFILSAPPGYDPQGPLGVGIATPGAVKVIPLTAKSCLMIFDRGDSIAYGDLPTTTVSRINLAIARNCDRFLVARDEAHVRFLVRKAGIARVPRVRHRHVQ